MSKTIFISYSWDDTFIANKLDEYFESVNIEASGFEIKRDVRQKLKINLKKFMQSVKTTDYVIPIISQNYLQSSNCMYEASEVLKSKDYRKRVIPIITETANIFTPEGKASCIKYWEQKIDKAKKSVVTLKNPQYAPSIFEDIRRFDKILHSIDDFALLITSDLGLNYNANHNEAFLKILNYIGFESLSTLKLKDEILCCENNDEQDKLLEEAIIKFPKDKHILLAKALVKEKQNYFDSAILIYKKLIEMYPNFGLPYLQLSDIYIKFYEANEKTDLTPLTKAKEVLEQAIKFIPDDKKISTNYSILLLNFGPAS